MQKTLTVHGKRFTSRQIAQLPREETNGGDYIVHLNGDKYFFNFRQQQDIFWAPVCDEQESNCIALTCGASHKPSIWMPYDPKYNRAAAALGSVRSERKAASSAANGKKGGRPKKQ